MTDFRYKRPKILWGAAFANTLNLGYPLDNVLAGPESRAGSEAAQAPSGVEDAWIVGTDHELEADIRWIPQTDTAVPAATGWDGATGFAAFLTWARDKNVFRFYPDRDGATYIESYLVEPMAGKGDIESDGTRRVRIRMRNSASAYEGY